VSEEQYTALYVPKKLVEEKEKAWFSLINIDCNFSKVLQMFIPQLNRLAKFIYKQGLNYRHFEWVIVIRDKRTNETFYSEDTEYENTETKKV
jgi:hypothetical protein